MLLKFKNFVKILLIEELNKPSFLYPDKTLEMSLTL